MGARLKSSDKRPLADWLRWQESLHSAAIDLGLDRVSTVARRMDLLSPDCPVVTVAGTNGKGSCVATLEQLLGSAGVSVGCFTSPHFHRYNERIRVDGREVSDADLCAAFEAINQARGEVSITYFEFSLLAALTVFAQAQVDVIVLEVGLGGRLDAANIVDADIAIVTSIALDHEDWLGSDIDQIGREKAGIFRPGRWALCADPSVPNTVAEVAASLGSRWMMAGQAFGIEVHTDGCWSWRGVDEQGECHSLSELPPVSLPLASVSAALQAFVLLGYRLGESEKEALQQLALPGRSQTVVQAGVDYRLDVAHNPAAAAFQAQKLKSEQRAGRVYCVCSMMADKDHQGVIAELREQIHEWVMCELPGNPRAASADQLVSCAQSMGATAGVGASVSEALSSLKSQLQAGDCVLICGSFFTVAEAQLALGIEQGGGD